MSTNDVVSMDVKVNGVVVGSLLFNGKTFSTGSIGYNATGKVFVIDSTHQLNANLVKIHSKPTKK